MKLVSLASGQIDYALNADGTMASESSLQSAVLISLLTERRAEDDDRLPYQPSSEYPVPADRKGWVGDGFGGQRIGSRLWLLVREKQTTETKHRAIEYAREALQWLLDDQHVVNISIEAEWNGIGRLEMLIRLQLPSGAIETFKFADGNVYVL